MDGARFHRPVRHKRGLLTFDRHHDRLRNDGRAAMRAGGAASCVVRLVQSFCGAIVSLERDDARADAIRRLCDGQTLFRRTAVGALLPGSLCAVAALHWERTGPPNPGYPPLP